MRGEPGGDLNYDECIGKSTAPNIHDFAELILFSNTVYKVRRDMMAPIAMLVLTLTHGSE